MILLAGYQVVLSRYSGQDRFAVGTPVAGRSRPELDGTVGMFVNMLPLRADLGGEPTADELIGRVRDAVLDALAHADVPFEKVINELGVPRDVSRPALFQAMIVLQNYELRDAAHAARPDTELRWKPVELPATRFDLELHAYPLDGGLQCRFVYNTALFTEATAARLAGALRAVLTALAATPQARLADLTALPPDQAALLARWNTTAVPVKKDLTLPLLFAEQVTRTPQATAVADERVQLSYAELEPAARRIAGELARHGAGPESVVAVLAQRSATWSPPCSACSMPGRPTFR